MSLRTEAVAGVPDAEAPALISFDAIFRAQYRRVVSLISRLVRDPARSEELAVEVFVKLWRTPRVQGENVQGWLSKVAVRKALDELRRTARWARCQHLFRVDTWIGGSQDALVSREERDRVRSILALLHRRQAELLLLRAEGLSYDEL